MNPEQPTALAAAPWSPTEPVHTYNGFTAPSRDSASSGTSANAVCLASICPVERFRMVRYTCAPSLLYIPNPPLARHE